MTVDNTTPYYNNPNLRDSKASEEEEDAQSALQFNVLDVLDKIGPWQTPLQQFHCSSIDVKIRGQSEFVLMADRSKFLLRLEGFFSSLSFTCCYSNGVKVVKRACLTPARALSQR